jgi:hypothetical protein
MNKNSLKVLSLIAVLTTAGLVLADTNDGDRTLNQIAGYRQWTRINQQPTVVVSDPGSIGI